MLNVGILWAYCSLAQGKTNAWCFCLFINPLISINSIEKTMRNFPLSVHFQKKQINK